MPFELGIATALSALKGPHDFFLFEAETYRLQTTLSDMNGRDPQIHGGRQEGALRCLLDCFATTRRPPAHSELVRVARRLSRAAGELKRSQRARNIFQPNLYRQLVEAATELAQEEGWIP